MILQRDFYQVPSYELAPRLIGARLVRVMDSQRMAGIITEVEAYHGMEDKACHARAGLTKRNAVMFGEAGHAYIYFTYGMHWLLNVVTDRADVPSALLIRAIYPVEGLEEMTNLRPNLAGTARWTDGPAKLTQALALTGELNGADLCSSSSGIFVEQGISVTASKIQISPRIGIGYAPEPWLSMPWRWELPYEKVRAIVKS